MNTLQALPLMEDGIFFAETPEQKDLVARLRYAIYPEEMGRYRDRADHAKKRLWEDADSWSVKCSKPFKPPPPNTKEAAISSTKPCNKIS